MNNLIISSDSTCDLSDELVSKYSVRIFPLSVILGSATYKDKLEIMPKDIFEYFEKTGELPKTAAPSVEEYEEFFKQFVEQGDTLIHFNISSKASGSYGFALAAAEKFKGKVWVIDTHALSTGQGLLVLKACDMRDEGKSAEEIYNYILSIRDKVNTSFIPDTLLYLYKGGRCSTLSYYGAKVLSIHPMISMKDGQLYPKKKYIGKMTRCLKNYIQDLAAEYKNYDQTRCFITHSNADEELVQEAREMVRDMFHFDVVLETVAGSIITSHCGRNTIGVLFITK